MRTQAPVRVGERLSGGGIGLELHVVFDFILFALFRPGGVMALRCFL